MVACLGSEGPPATSCAVESPISPSAHSLSHSCVVDLDGKAKGQSPFSAAIVFKATSHPARCSCVVDLDGVVKRQWRIQRIQEVLVAKGGRYILVSPNLARMPGQGALSREREFSRRRGGWLQLGPVLVDMKTIHRGPLQS